MRLGCVVRGRMAMMVILAAGCASAPAPRVARSTPAVSFHAVVALEDLAEPAALEEEEPAFRTMPRRAPGMRALYTYRAGPRPAEWAFSMRSVRLAGVHPESHRAVFVLVDGLYGARSGEVRERVDVIDYRRRRHVDRVTGEYGVHVAGSDEEGIQRLTGEFRDDVSILARLVHQVGVEYWGDEPLAVSPSGRAIVTRAPRRRSLLVTDRYGHRRRWLLPDSVFGDGDPVFSADDRHVAVPCGEYSGASIHPREGLCFADARDGGWSLVELPQLSRPVWRDADTLDVISFEHGTADDGGGRYEACLHRVELDPPSATRTRCWEAWYHRRPLHAVPGDPSTAVLRLDPRVRYPSEEEPRLAWIHLGDGEVLREVTIPRYWEIVRVLSGARVIVSRQGEARVVDLAERAVAELGPAELGGELGDVHRVDVDGRERVYAQIRLDENRHRLVELDLDPLFAP